MYALPLRRWISLILVKLGPAHTYTNVCSLALGVGRLGGLTRALGVYVSICRYKDSVIDMYLHAHIYIHI